MPEPTPPTVPPPALRSDPDTFRDRAEANISFFGPLINYMAEVVSWVGTKVSEVTAVAMAGDLPALTGKSGKALKVSADETGLEFQDVGTTGQAVLETETDAEAQGVLGLGTAATVNTGTTVGTVPLLGASGKLDASTLPAAASFVSAEQAVVVNSKLTVAHGLGATPTDLKMVLVCKTADAPYVVGEHLDFPSSAQIGGSEYGASLSATGTNIHVRTGAAISVVNDAGAAKNLVVANWRYVITAKV